MKTTTRKLAPAAIALLCVAMANWARANDESYTSKEATGHEMGNEMKSSEGEPARFNKASGIVGMDVRNQNGEHLGHIKDVVFDWKTERVSYAVISTAPKAMLGIKEKLLAVPLNALTVGSDEKHLVLNADKSKVEAAAGFERNNWPSVSSPSWGAQPFWESTDQTPGSSAMPSKNSESTPKPEMIPESKSNTNEQSTPNMAPESKPDTDEESAPNTEPESKPDAESESVPDL